MFAAGVAGEIWQYDGTMWSLLDPGGVTPTFVDIWFPTPNEPYFLAGSTIRHYDGTSWATVPTTTPGLDLYSAIWGTGPNDFFVVGSSTNGTTPIAHFTGTWETTTLDGDRLLTIWGTAGNDVFAAAPGAIYHYDTVWTKMMTPSTVTPIVGLHGSSGDDVFAVGEGGEIWHYTGN